MQTVQASTDKEQRTQPNPLADLDVANNVSFENFKKSLGANADKYTDDQIEKMRIICDRIADLVFDAWLNRKNKA